MNMFKNNGGFTLVELVVVIAILAILAGIAVPAYSSYIENAEAAVELAEDKQAEIDAALEEAEAYLPGAAGETTAP